MWENRFGRPFGGYSFPSGCFISVPLALPTELTLQIRSYDLSDLDLLPQLSKFLLPLLLFLAWARLAQLPQVGYLDGCPDGPAFSEHGIVWFGKAFVYEDYFSFWFLCRFIAHANYLRDKKDPGEVTITS